MFLRPGTAGGCDPADRRRLQPLGQRPDADPGRPAGRRGAGQRSHAPGSPERPPPDHPEISGRTHYHGKTYCPRQHYGGSGGLTGGTGESPVYHTGGRGNFHGKNHLFKRPVLLYPRGRADRDH